jgi:hypothetical protein
MKLIRFTTAETQVRLPGDRACALRRLYHFRSGEEQLHC